MNSLILSGAETSVHLLVNFSEISSTLSSIYSIEINILKN